MDTSVEKRAFPRKGFNDMALLQIGTDTGDIFERAQVENISFGGICFTNIKALKGFEHVSGSVLENNQALVYFQANQITVFGTVTRIEPSKDRMALCVKRSTDDDLWTRLCT
ncbi:MAG TPA: hypothetical protein PLB81_02890 [Deltaproteobacteria bacterium]|nr:hypothetical protein [Deltaproteobacteria bacterium]